jgi:hypothetical protein
MDDLLGLGLKMVGPPGVAPGLHRLRVGRTVCQYSGPGKKYCHPQELQRWELNPLSAGYEPVRSPFAFAAISPAHGSKGDTHPGLAPGKIGFADRRLVDLAMCVNTITAVRKTQVYGTRTHPAGFTGPNAAATSSPGSAYKWVLRSASHRHRLLYERSAFLHLPQRNGCSREDLHLEPPPSHGGMQGSYTSGAKLGG